MNNNFERSLLKGFINDGLEGLWSMKGWDLKIRPGWTREINILLMKTATRWARARIVANLMLDRLATFTFE